MKNILRIIIINLILSLGAGYAYASNLNLDSIAVLLKNGEIDAAHHQLKSCANKVNNNQLANFHYYYGAVEELSGNIYEAIKHYRECMVHSEQMNQRDESYIDAAARCIHHSIEEKDWLSVVRLSRQALTVPDSVMQLYPNTFNIYDWYLGALNTLGKYEIIPVIAHHLQR